MRAPITYLWEWAREHEKPGPWAPWWDDDGPSGGGPDGDGGEPAPLPNVGNNPTTQYSRKLATRQDRKRAA